MDGRPARDRLAVWTYAEHGEEIPCGDPSVTDAERAAAGRETLAERRRAVLPGSRSRAAAQYSAGLPGGEDMVRVWRQRDPAALRARLGETPLVAWAEDDVLHVLWRGTADEVMLGAGVQPRLWPVEGAGDLWEASLRIRRLDEAVSRSSPSPGGRAATSPGGCRTSWCGAARARPPRCPPCRSRPACWTNTPSTAPRCAGRAG
jgi:hypothetical protein